MKALKIISLAIILISHQVASGKAQDFSIAAEKAYCVGVLQEYIAEYNQPAQEPLPSDPAFLENWNKLRTFFYQQAMQHKQVLDENILFIYSYGKANPSFQETGIAFIEQGKAGRKSCVTAMSSCTENLAEISSCIANIPICGRGMKCLGFDPSQSLRQK